MQQLFVDTKIQNGAATVVIKQVEKKLEILTFAKKFQKVLKTNQNNTKAGF